MSSPSNKVLSVEQLNRKARKLLEEEFPSVTVEGELSNFSRPGSGHWYFTLKDSKAQIRSAMFRGYNARLKFTPSNGDRIEVRGKVSLYEGRGDFQLIAESMSPAGLGLLQQRFEELKAKLAEQGYFDQDRKQVLPEVVKRIAIVTSPSGAAVRDMIAVLERRNPFLSVDIFPSLVQGEGAAATITAQLKKADQLDYDLIVLTRGGGSLEDLWSFNDEALADAIFHAKAPVISAVGHEIDFSISDFVADLRAPTPSAAAELLSRDMSELPQALSLIEARLVQTLKRVIGNLKKDVRLARASLRNPQDRIYQLGQAFDFKEGKLVAALQTAISKRREQLAIKQLRLSKRDPRTAVQLKKASLARLEEQLLSSFERRSIAKKQEQLGFLIQRLRAFQPLKDIKQQQLDIDRLRERLIRAQQTRVDQLKARFAKSDQSLNLVSPTAVMERGYSIIFDQHGNAIRSASTLQADHTIHARFHEGEAEALVTQVIMPKA